VQKSAALRDTKAPPAETITTVRGLINGHWVTQAIHVLVRLGVPDQLADGPRSATELAATANSHEQSLYRVLRALAAIGLLNELPDRCFELTALGETLRSDVPGSLAGWAAFVGSPYEWKVWGRLYDGVMTGEHAFRLEHGIGPWEYRQRHPEEVTVFNRAMNSLTASISPAVVSGYDFSTAKSVVDVGGGGGLLLTEILKSNPRARGILFDLPDTVDDARAFVSASGVGERCELIPGDFFKSVPPGADVYLLKSIIHDWYDKEASAILTTVRGAARPDSALLVIEQILAGPNEGAPAKLGDLNMMVAAGGQERTREEWEKLFAATGWRLDEVRPAGRLNILVTRPA
jgi:hypothetical protein